MERNIQRQRQQRQTQGPQTMHDAETHDFYHIAPGSKYKSTQSEKMHKKIEFLHGRNDMRTDPQHRQRKCASETRQGQGMGNESTNATKQDREVADYLRAKVGRGGAATGGRRR